MLVGSLMHSVLEVETSLVGREVKIREAEEDAAGGTEAAKGEETEEEEAAVVAGREAKTRGKSAERGRSAKEQDEDEDEEEAVGRRDDFGENSEELAGEAAVGTDVDVEKEEEEGESEWGPLLQALYNVLRNEKAEVSVEDILDMTPEAFQEFYENLPEDLQDELKEQLLACDEARLDKFINELPHELVDDLYEEDPEAEDHWAIRFLETMASFAQLTREGKTREVYLFGKVQGQWLRGYVDQIEMDSEGHALIVENKFRRSAKMPTPAQERTSLFQAQLYCLLYEGLAEFLSGPDAVGFLEAYNIDVEKVLWSDIRKKASRLGLHNYRSLEKAVEYLREAAEKLPPLSPRVVVRYFFQGTGELLGEVEAAYSKQQVLKQVTKTMGFWKGSKPPKKVPGKERWKCNFCQYQDLCHR
eukprot:jgi/Botrbrau1/14225/Bobra.0254s0014.1